MYRVVASVCLAALLCGCGGSSAPDSPNALDGLKETSAQRQAKTIAEALDTYDLHHNSTYPSDLTVLTQPDDELNGQAYMKPEMIKDPWGKQYQLDTSGAKPVVFTISPAGKRISSADR
jgi:hypothetical protein